ncbi:MAG: hypothetical protein F6J95_028025 [Leptolyngbya sp. SIO1E4]|nr:hypothetical protein [Leptolyngbya sp. SIO1E4]
MPGFDTRVIKRFAQSLMGRVLPVVVIGAVIALFLTTVPFPAQARSCYPRNGHEICLERVQRSAKYHLQYQVKATIDGKPQPLMLYNCRDRFKTPLEGPEKGFPIKFSPEGIGERLCALVGR